MLLICHYYILLTNMYLGFFLFNRVSDIGQELTTYFLHPDINSTRDDFMKFLPDVANPTFDLEEAEYILDKIADEFCYIYGIERETYLKHVIDCPDDKSVIWKPPLEDQREICDVCQTTYNSQLSLDMQEMRNISMP
jgi:hypothetical protein